MADPASLASERRAIRSLLVPHDAGDARTAYYALQHPPQRTALTLHRTDAGHVEGFLATCVTGANPFQPLVVLRAFGPGTLKALIDEALAPGRSYLFSVPVYIGAELGRMLALSEEITWRILHTDASRFVPLINVLVTQEQGGAGQLRWHIRSQGRVAAAAGINWRDSRRPHPVEHRWAEVYVTAQSAARARRRHESVLAAATSALLAEGLTPLYFVAQGDSRARQAAEGRGYYDSGAREFTCVGTVPA